MDIEENSCDENIDVSTSMPINYENVMLKQMSYLVDVLNLLRFDTSSVQFANTVRGVVYKYHSISSPADMPLLPDAYAPLNHINSNSYIISNNGCPECLYKIPMVLFQYFLPLRDDFDRSAASLVSAIYDESILNHGLQNIQPHLNSNSSTSLSAATSTSNQNNIKSKITLPHVRITPTGAIYDKMIRMDELYLHVFTEEEVLCSSVSTSKDSNVTNSSHVLGITLASPQGLKSFNPANTLKVIRERAADINVLSSIGVGLKRKNEEYALQLYRSLGLEELMDKNHYDHNRGDDVVSVRLENSFIGDSDDNISLGKS